MRILCVIPELSLGGTERQLLLLASALVDRGHAVRILALRPPRRPFPFDRPLDVQTLNIRSGWAPSIFTGVLRQILCFRPDVLHTFLFGFDLLPNLAARLARVPCIVSSRRELATWQRRRHRVVQSAANLFVDAIVANSLAASEYACLTERALHRGMVCTIPNAHQPRSPAVEEALPVPPKPVYCILNIANFWPGKGHAALIRAFAEFQTAVPDSALWLVGQGPEAPRLIQLARDLRLEDRVVFLGPRHDIDRILDHADLYVHASAMESSPNAVLEAMGATVPVVAVACGGVTELLRGGDFGLLVARSEPTALAAGMRHVVAHHDAARARAAAAAAGVATCHTPAILADRHLAVYRQASRATPPAHARPPTVALYTLGDMRSPSARVRALQYVPALQEAGLRVRHYALPMPHGGRWGQALGLLRHAPLRAAQLLAGARADTVLVQKGLTPARWRGLTRLLRSRATRLVVDIDDAVHQVFPIAFPRPWRWLQDAHEPQHLLRDAACILAGNTTLAASLPSHHGRVDILPTVVDLDRIADGSWRFDDADNRAPFRLLWAGQRSTLPYLIDVLPALAEVATRLQPRHVHLSILCDAFPGITPGDWVPLRIELQPWSLDEELALLQSADVGIMPLPNDKWTRAKCGFKLLCYMAAGLPAVASPVGVNAAIAEEGITGFLAVDHRAWVEHLVQLAGDASIRGKLGRQARQRARAHYALSAWRDRFVHRVEGRTP